MAPNGAKPAALAAAGQSAGIHRPQCSDIGCVQSSGQRGAGFLRGGGPEASLLQLRSRDHICALRNSLGEQPTCHGRSHQVHHAQAASRFACDGHIRGIAPESADVLLDPSQRLNLIEQAVIAGYPKRRLRAKFRMREISEDSKTIVDGDDDDALRGQPCTVIDLSLLDPVTSEPP